MSPGQKKQDQSEESDKYQERTDRILDAASDLIQRYGYKKTTIDDIARQAGVAKGTIYLHWKTRDQLFLDLLLREKHRAALEMQESLANDPEGTTLHTMSKYSLILALKNPLLRAVMLRDHDTLGHIMQDHYDRQIYMEQIQSFNTFLNYLRQQGLIRTDQTLEEQTYLIVAITIGFLTVNEYIPPEFQPSIEESGELLGDTIRRTFAIRPLNEMEKEITHMQMEDIVNSTQNMNEEEEHE